MVDPLALVHDMRTVAGQDFDWCFAQEGEASQNEMSVAVENLHDDGRIQQIAPRRNPAYPAGEHAWLDWFGREAQRNGYKYVLQVDEFITPKTKNWLAKLVEGFEYARTLNTAIRAAGGALLGYRGRKPTVLSANKYGDTHIEIVDMLPSALRLTTVEVLEEMRGDHLQLPLYALADRRLATHEAARQGVQIRLPRIRVYHQAARAEARMSADEHNRREMEGYWPAIPGVTNCG